MKKNVALFIFSFIVFTLLSSASNSGLITEQAIYRNDLIKKKNSLVKLHKKLGKPGPTDWLAKHKEPGESFEEYLDLDPILPTEKKKYLYVSQLGELTPQEKEILKITEEFLAVYFNIPVKEGAIIASSEIPKKMRRKSPIDGTLQFYTTYILYDILLVNIPDDAAAYFAITQDGLWPGKDWNYVHGQASLWNRVAGCSLWNYGKPIIDGKINKIFLSRVLKLTSHEMGHMFSMNHCIKYECNMCGGNHIAEMDRYPLWLCPECMAKVCWLTKISPEERYENLKKFYKKHGLDREYQFCNKSLKILKDK